MEGSPGLQDVKKLKHVGCVWTRVVVKAKNQIRKLVCLFNRQADFHNSFHNVVRQ